MPRPRRESLLGKLYHDVQGHVAVAFALGAVPLFLAAGVATDFGRMHTMRANLQIVADAAALSGAALIGAAADDRKATARLFLTENLPDNAGALTTTVSVNGNEVSVTITTTLSASLMQIAGIETTRVTTTSVAAFKEGGGPCILTLHPNEKEALMVNSDSRINAPDCLVQVNSSNSEALVGNSNGDITAGRICVNGGWDTNSGSQFVPSPEDCPPAEDPLAQLPVPAEASGSCDWTDRKVEGTRTLSPGVYCKKLEIDSGANVTFRPGIYVIRDGEFIVNSGSSATGTGVMFFLTGDENNPRFNINSGSHINFSAPTSGTYAGMVFYQDRDVESADFSILNSDSSSIIEGVIYLPTTGLHLNSHGNISAASPWTILITHTLEVNSHSVLNIRTNYADSSVPVPAGLGGGIGGQTVWLKQ